MQKNKNIEDFTIKFISSLAPGDKHFYAQAKKAHTFYDLSVKTHTISLKVCANKKNNREDL